MQKVGRSIQVPSSSGGPSLSTTTATHGAGSCSRAHDSSEGSTQETRWRSASAVSEANVQMIDQYPGRAEEGDGKDEIVEAKDEEHLSTTADAGPSEAIKAQNQRKKQKATLQEIEEDEILKVNVDEEDFSDDLYNEIALKNWNKVLAKAKKYQERKKTLEEILRNKELAAEKKSDGEDQDRIDEAGSAAEDKEKKPETVSTQKKSRVEKIKCCCW
ncbi:hypothetical protein Ancab_037687 [Ancistrocladus abbreviatus]